MEYINEKRTIKDLEVVITNDPQNTLFGEPVRDRLVQCYAIKYGKWASVLASIEMIKDLPFFDDYAYDILSKELDKANGR